MNLNNDTTLCQGTFLKLSIPTINAHYLWSTNETTNSITTSNENLYWAKVSNKCGVASDTLKIKFESPITVDLGTPDTVLCKDEFFTISSNVIANKLIWNDGSIFDNIIANHPNTYKLTATNACGSSSDTMRVDYDEKPITHIDNNGVYCRSNLITLDATWSRANYLWNDGSTNNTLKAKTDGRYWVQVSNLCGTNSDTVQINYDDPIDIHLGPDTIMCVGDNIQLTAPDVKGLIWNNLETTPKIIVHGYGIYSAKVKNACGTFIDEIHIRKLEIPKITPINDTSFCKGESYTQNISPSTSDGIIWMDKHPNYHRLIDSSATYSYQLSNVCGVISDTFNVKVDTIEIADLGSDTIICFGETISKSFNYPGYTYLWSDGNTGASNSFKEKGVYSVTMTSPEQCQSDDEFIIEYCHSQPFIPNTFTPSNSDNLNKYFQVKGVGIYKFRIMIYDRWGTEVFQSFDINNSWDGTFKGEDCSQDIYFYKIWYNNGETSRSITLVGKVLLLR